MSVFKGTGVAIITPFNQNKSIDYPALEKLIHFIIDGGVNYIVTLGTTGETPVLSREEKIDIIKWSSNIAELVISSLTPAKVSKVVVDEENNLIEVVVAEDQLSLAIGRGGQNVKLASKLVGYKIDVMTDDQESARRTAEFNQASKLFIEALDVEDMIASLLASEGFLNVESIANAEISDISSIEGFDDEIAKEIKRRAEEYIQKSS